MQSGTIQTRHEKKWIQHPRFHKRVKQRSISKTNSNHSQSEHKQNKKSSNYFRFYMEELELSSINGKEQRTHIIELVTPTSKSISRNLSQLSQPLLKQ